MKNSVIKNPEFKNIFISASIIFLGINFIYILSMYFTYAGLNRKIIIKNLSYIGKTVSKNPELESDIMESILNNADDRYIELGKSIAAKYGYKPNTKLNIIPIIYDYYNINIAYDIIFFIATIVALYIVLYKNFKILYDKLSYLCISTEKIVDGNFKVKLFKEKEGELSKLNFEFNRMSKCLQLTLEELREEKKLLKNMISDISHQLKTPLTSLKMFNELLLDGADEQPEIRREFLGKSLVQIDRMEWLIHTLLKMARLETGIIELNKEESDLCKSIKEEIMSLNMKIKMKNIQLITNGLDKSLYLKFDKKWMGEAIRNVINNAIVYTPNYGTIIISIENKEGIIKIIIEDTGIGISKEDLPHIFSRFYQGKNSKTMSQNGSGIGLSLTKLIIEKHNGFIEVNSSLGEGSTFKFILPME